MFPFKKKQAIDNLEEFRDITDDVIEGDFVPYACHYDPNTIITKNGEILQTIKITGFVHEQVADETSEDDSDLRARIREAVLTCVDSSKYSVWVHTVRRKTSIKTAGEYKRDFSGYLNQFWNNKNDWENKFSNEVYLTIIRDDKQGADLFNPDNFIRGIIPKFDIAYREKMLEQTRKELNAITKKMLPILERYGAYRLGVVKRGDTYYSEPCEFLGKLITMLDLEFPVADIDLSHYLTDYDVTFGYNAMEVRMRSDGKRRFGAILTVKEYRELETSQLDRLLQVPIEFIISQSFEFIPARIALKSYEKQKELFSISKSQDLAEKIGLNAILASNKGKQTDFGRHQLNMFILADSVRILEHSVTKMVSALASLGLAPMREDIKGEECYWAMLPANFEFVRRQRPLNTARIAGFANLSNYPAGKKDGNLWGDSVTTVYTAARTPYFFNFHYKDNGHTAIIGTENSGKTVLLNFLLAEARKFDNKLFFFDINRESEIFIRSLNGVYYNPSQNAANYAEFKLNASLPEFADLLVEFPHLFANTETIDFSQQICGFEMAQIISNPKLLIPVLSYLLKQIEQQLDGTPAIIVFSEAWKMLDNECFIPRISEMLKNWQKKNVIAIFATESVDEIKNSRLNFEILPQIATQIYLPDEEADSSYKTFGLNEKEIDYLAMMNADDHHFLLKQAGSTIIAEIELNGMHDILAVLHAERKNLQIMEEKIAETSINSAEWIPKFLETV